MSTVDAILAQYEKSQSGGAQNKMSQDERLKKYFTCLLPENKKNDQKRIRILPMADGTSPFKEAWFHEIMIGGQLNKIYDPGLNDNEKSPLTEIYEELKSTQRKEDEELAKQYKARKFYIVKVIDRDNPQDGPKFWRFKHNYKKEGIFDKIFPIIKNKGDIFNELTGRDLIVDLTKNKSPKGKDYTVVSSIIYDDPSPLHENPEIAKEWINDSLTWRDVYSKKPLEYLEAIARGETPKWDNDKGGWVYSDPSSNESVIGGKSLSYDDDSSPDIDLPF